MGVARGGVVVQTGSMGIESSWGRLPDGSTLNEKQDGALVIHAACQSERQRQSARITALTGAAHQCPEDSSPQMR